MRPRPKLLVTLVVLAALLPMAQASGTATVETAIEVRVLSNRADLVSGGDALVEIVLPDGEPADNLIVRNHEADPDDSGTDVTAAFSVRADGRLMGLVDGLALGPNLLTAMLPDGRGSRITVTNHPIGGPVFSGPQVQPWVCETVQAQLGPPQDDQCNAPSTVRLQYMSTSGGPFRPYDPALPPPDIAKVTTDEGITVPYIVRRERGTINRGIYEFAVLYDPSQPWELGAPQAAWNEKLYYYFDGGATPQRRQGTLLDEVMVDLALRRGYVVAYTTLNRFGFNTNSVTSAESALMLKEKIAETLGPIRHTISHGGSGGSIQQHLIVEGYPGLLDGVQPGGSFQDLVTANVEGQDCSLLVRYFTQTSPLLWLDGAQQAAVFGNEDSLPGTCRAIIAFWLDRIMINPVEGLACGGGNGVGPGTPQPWAYHPVTNPDGARCTLQDHQVAIYGNRPADEWGDVEMSLAHGFANRPYDNVGVQYGLQALNDGTITVDQFVDLNTKIGGRDIDGGWQVERSVADTFALEAAYRSGQVNSGRGIASTPTFDLRNCSNNEFHSCYHTWVMRERVVASGAAAGHVAFLQESQELSVDMLDRWVTDIVADTSTDPLPDKVARHRPAEAVDACWQGNEKVTDMTVCLETNPYFANPRIAAGGPLSDDVLKCRLVEPERSAYAVTFTDQQWEALVAAFPSGVCDWSQSSVGYQPSIPWLTYLTDDGRAIPGGVPLGPAPVSEPFAAG